MNTYASKNQMVELGTSLLKALVDIEDAPKTRVQELIENPAELKDIARRIVMVSTVPGVLPCKEKNAFSQIDEWQMLYAEMGITLDVSGLKIPERKPGFDRLIFVPKGMTPQQAFDLCGKRFGGRVWKYSDRSLDVAVPTNDRDPKNGAYAIWVRDRVEADKELKNKSANDLAEEKIKGITLLERLLLELKYHKETGEHLDIKNWTLCSGSRNSGGNVLDVGWYDVELEVNWNNVSYRNSNLRSREVSRKESAPADSLRLRLFQPAVC